MNKVFTSNGWEDYIYWQTEDKKTLKKINTLLKDIDRNGNEGSENQSLLLAIYLDFGVGELMKRID